MTTGKNRSFDYTDLFSKVMSLLFNTRPRLVLPGGLHGKESARNVRDSSLIPGSGRFSGEGHGNPFQYFCMENSMDRRPWQATVHRVSKSQI